MGGLNKYPSGLSSKWTKFKSIIGWTILPTHPKSLLLSADIEKKTEKRLVKYQYDKLKSTYLVSPHHGSKTSSLQAFLDAVDPDYILIPVGFKNRYRMPHFSVMKRYLEAHVPIIETYKSGAILVRFGQKSSSTIPKQYRNINSKYWNSQH